MKGATFACLVLAALPAAAQLAAPNAEGISMGHIHLFVKDVDAQKEFWTKGMGGILKGDGALVRIQIPGVYILISKSNSDREPPLGSIVNHFGLVVKDMPGTLARWKANNITIEPTENPNEAYAVGPDGVRVEVYGIPTLAVPVQMNHVHFYAADIRGMQAWYAKVFGAKPGRRPCVACVSRPRLIETDDVPGVNLSFSSGAAGLAGTKGRSLDHIGFEVKDLDKFVKRAEAHGVKFDRGVTQAKGRATTALLTDPWGTYIELTEGLETR